MSFAIIMIYSFIKCVEQGLKMQRAKRQSGLEIDSHTYPET